MFELLIGINLVGCGFGWLILIPFFEEETYNIKEIIKDARVGHLLLIPALPGVILSCIMAYIILAICDSGILQKRLFKRRDG